jgi:hypothetical protein
MLAHGKRSAAVGKGRPINRQSPGGATEPNGGTGEKGKAGTARFEVSGLRSGGGVVAQAGSLRRSNWSSRTGLGIGVGP